MTTRPSVCPHCGGTSPVHGVAHLTAQECVREVRAAHEGRIAQLETHVDALEERLARLTELAALRALLAELEEKAAQAGQNPAPEE